MAKISFINCRFKNIFKVRDSESCNFENWKFSNFNARKSLFSNCQFKNCQITNCIMTRLQFSNSSFTNCEFVKVNLAASDFMKCKFKKTNFIESNLNTILVYNVKIWKSDNLIKVENSDDFKKLLINNNSN